MPCHAMPSSARRLSSPRSTINMRLPTLTILRKMSTMRAVQVHQTGGPEALLLTSDAARPEAGPGQLLVRNAFAGVNYIDTYHRTGLYKMPLPFIPGREASGVVAAVGSGVSSFKVGDRVAYSGSGGYSEYSAVPQGYTVKLPESVSDETGAALLLQGLTALSLARIAHAVNPTETVLIYAAAGGTGQMLVQVCKHIGATVIGITSTAEKAALAKAAGADHVITYANEDVLTRVMEITGGQGVHAVFDGVGKTSFDTSLACLRKLGSMLSFGNASGMVDPIVITKLVPKQIRLMRPSLFQLVSTPEEFQPLAKELVELVANKKLSVHIHKIYELSDTASAHIDLESGKTLGKLLVRI
ncbi:hypothetical protein BC831DRAFT_448148 [Entophlyctis helioformis]|nr:hypothetical protein BC831DRAFT_448148 [Entophlyctis helioformis]